jgi:choline kinase
VEEYARVIVVILAAGMGKRLMPLTKERPKALLKMNGKTILENIIEKCVKNYIKKFIITVGYKKEAIRSECDLLRVKYNIEIHLIENKRYFETNTGYSLYLALKKINDDVLIINGDNLFDEQIVINLLKSSKSAIVIDNVKKLNKESFKISLDKNTIKDMGKKISIASSNGEFIGISKVNNEDIFIFKKILCGIIKKNLEEFYDIAFKESNGKIPLDFIYTNGLNWTEVDTYNDFENAKKLVNKQASNR